MTTCINAVLCPQGGRAPADSSRSLPRTTLSAARRRRVLACSGIEARESDAGGAQLLDVRLGEDVQQRDARCGRALRLSAGGCAVVELLAEVGFEPVQLSDERGPVDPDRACGGVD